MKFSKLFDAFAAVSLLTASAFFASCHNDSDSSSHEHTFATEWTIDATSHWHAATCEHKEQVKDKAAHSFGDWKTIKEVTEEADGLKEKECEICHYAVIEIISSPEHNHNIAAEWTCDGNYHWHAADCGREEHNEGKAAHVWIDGEIIKQPTETEDGEREVSCECGAASKKIIPPLGHQHEIAKTYTNDETHHWYVASCGREEHNEGKSAHNFEIFISKSPNSIEKRIKTAKCMDCGYSTEEEISVLPHRLGKYHNAVAGTCKTKGTIAYYECANAGCTVKLDKDLNVLSSIEGELNPSNHEGTATWKITAETHKEIYDCCDAVKTAESVHTWYTVEITKDPTAAEEGVRILTCEICNHTKTESIEKLPEGFVYVTGVEITGSESWTPGSNVFIRGRSFSIPPLIVCDHEVTRGEFKKLMGNDPSVSDMWCNPKPSPEITDLKPVDSVNWYMAIAYCNKLSIEENLAPCYSVEGITDWKNLNYDSIPTSSDAKWNAVICDFAADGYRLPTDDEWEWHARGGAMYTYAGSNDIDEVAWWYKDGSNDGTRAVKTKKSNGYGLYDMSGNVQEWCWDSGQYYDVLKNENCEGRCLRGGSWGSTYEDCAVFIQNASNPCANYYLYGFRVVRSINW